MYYHYLPQEQTQEQEQNWQRQHPMMPPQNVYPSMPAHPAPGQNLEQRVYRLENEVDRLQRQVRQLERRLRRLEGGGY